MAGSVERDGALSGSGGLVRADDPGGPRVRDCAERLQELRDDRSFVAAVAVMSCLRRAYAAALRSLVAAAEATGLLPDGFVDLALEYVAWLAERPLPAGRLAQDLREVVVPWADGLAAGTPADAGCGLPPLPVGFRVYRFADGLPRERPVVLVGEADAVVRLLRQVVAGLAARPGRDVRVVHLTARVPRREEVSAWSLRFGPAAWSGRAGSAADWSAFWEEVVVPALDLPPDLVVVDDLAKAGGPGVPPGDVCRVLAAWAAGQGVGLLAGLAADGPADTSGPAYAQLRALATLRTVSLWRDAARPGEAVVTVSAPAGVVDTVAVGPDGPGGDG